LDPIRVLLPPDHPVVGTGTHILEETRHLLENLMPDILLVEMTLSDEMSPPPAERVRSDLSSPRVFVLRDSHNCTYVFGLQTRGSIGGLSEHEALQTIAETVRAERIGLTGDRRRRIVAKRSAQALEGDSATLPNLTAREVDVLQQLLTGKTNQGISVELGISEWTVRYHLKNIFRKLGVKRRSEAIAWVVQTGWVAQMTTRSTQASGAEARPTYPNG
jgi:DNA-binding NarL/FixJ family response regulator